MIIAVGTTNPAKLAAVRELQAKWPQLRRSVGPEGSGVGYDTEVVGAAVPSGVRPQPLTLEETIEGAQNRARAAWSWKPWPDKDRLAIGLESGLMTAKFRTLDVCACVLYDGKKLVVGLSGAWELPAEATALCLTRGFDLTQAMLKLGLTADQKINEHGGAIACLTEGRITRTEYTKQAIEMALAGWGK